MADAPATLDGAIRRAIANASLERLDDAARAAYYESTCASLGLNPLTRPFEFIELDGKLMLYAKRDATDQLRRKHHVSIEILDRALHDDVYVVRARALTPEGRTDESLGAVSLTGLHGVTLANALMTAETKAKRRVTLSICGLGFLDETEVDTLAAVHAGHASPSLQEPTESSHPTAATVLRAWDAAHPTDRTPLYSYVKAAYGKRVLGLTSEQVLEVLDWIATQAPTPEEAPVDAQ